MLSDAFKLEVKIPIGFEGAYDFQESCPKWTNNATGLHLWIDYIDPKDREVQGQEQFALSYINDGHTIVETNDYKEILEAIEHIKYGYYMIKVASSRSSDDLVELMSWFTRRVNSAQILEQDLCDIARVYKLAGAQHTFLVNKELNT